MATPEEAAQRYRDHLDLHRMLGYGNLGGRVYLRLLRADINSIADLRKWTYSDLLELKHFGEGMLNHVIQSLAYYDNQQRAGGAK